MEESDRHSVPEVPETADEGDHGDITRPPIQAVGVDTVDVASTSSSADQTRAEKWNSLAAAIKSYLPSMPASQPTPVKRRKLPDPLEPEPKYG